ncbi:MAG TPA: 4'-phosphopantetheinyl transferase superfamily protein [Candidatus Methylomirabilis sp.]|nr:4'-phosphopantetheinyl transferase superfamily protein [Candidatus Methylomirabilis sp.]
MTRCGIDTVEIARVERLLHDSSLDDLQKLFSPQELRDSGEGPGRAASLSARVAAKEACLKLFPRETTLGLIGPEDFSILRDGYGAPQVACSPTAREVLDRHRLKTISLSLTHDRTTASAIAMAEPAQVEVPLTGKLIYHLLPIRRRVVLSNLRRVFGSVVTDAEIRRLGQAHYAHLARLVGEFLRFYWLSNVRRAALVRVENIEAMLRAADQGKGVLVLTGHFGNWEIATVAGISGFPQYRGRIHFVRRPLQPHWFDALVTRRFRRAGFGVLPKRGALEAILQRLEAGDAVVFVFDQHAGGTDGIPVEFFGYPAGTFRSLAILALATGTPVVPAASWREPDGRHVLRFEEALPLIECEDTNQAIRKNTRAYNAALERLVLRHPEQWFWVHRRWKVIEQGRA